MKESDYRKLIERANAGDALAAVTLAQFEDERFVGGTPDGGRKWWILAAERGECQALRHMRDEAIERGQRAAADKWRTRIRWNKCAPSVQGERWYGGK